MSAATPPTERRVSARVGAISESATLAVDAKAKALKAAGRPVIAGDIPPLQEIVREGIDGLLAKNEPESIAKAILAALPDVPAVNPEALLGFFTFGYVAGEPAVFDGMRRLGPGTAMTVDVRTGRTDVETFWRWPDSRTQATPAR